MIYLDSCIVIYLVEKHPIFYETVERHFRENVMEGFAISPLVILECTVGPLKRGDEALERRFEQFFATVTRLNLDEAVFRRAAEKRAQFGIKTPDALHLSAAEHHGCSQVWTNDDRLAKVTPLMVNILRGAT